MSEQVWIDLAEIKTHKITKISEIHRIVKSFTVVDYDSSV